MVLKSEIEKAFHRQQANLVRSKKSIHREYFSKMKLNNTHIEVISGIRRCGKSTLLNRITKEYEGKIIYFNFEDSRIFDFELSDFNKLDDIIGTDVSAYFFDEIQNIPSWEIFIRELHDRGEKIFITGSNAALLSKELGTRLTGRHIRHELFPFSFNEYLVYRNTTASKETFENYIEEGGFPEYLANDNQEILQNLLKDIVLRDIAIRHGIKNTKALMEITLFLISNVGKECTYNSVRKTFSVGSVNSISDYLTWLEDSYLLFFIQRFSYSTKVSSVNPRKIYGIDTALVMANSLSFTEDKGRLLENCVFLHLRRNYEKIFYFKEKGECDFVVFEKNKCTKVIQVCFELHDENKKRELNGLLEAMEYFKLNEGYILTHDQKDELIIDKKKILLLPIHEWISVKR